MSTSTKASTAPKVKQTSRLRSLSLPIAFIGLGVLIALLFGYFQTTVVTGSEFDTGSWTVRTFWYRRDPFTGRQLTGILREPPNSISTTPAFPNSYFSGASSMPARWDLVKLQSGAVLSEGPAFVLDSYFERYLADEIWSTWSKENPTKAKSFWPAVRDLVDFGLYHELPKVMELAKVDSTDEEFKTMIDEKMKSIITAHVEKLRVEENANDLPVAKTVLSKYSASK